ncbi:histidine ammonia-lyase [Haloarcula onubensis]|uniref:Probable histidine ammonia-lyase n=1 Tax=Haloarcula onubensis TaxID=2950539 RepID=A0ABU2FJU0_9EURY|nr:histidine ammonia-lyase [Halomicroarcula sp. S3CR25-11]MDS0281026.1 histidine ammonia-lyase [Halomicroarcula sp. S3CR25-11]
MTATGTDRVVLDGASLTPEAVVAVAREDATVTVADDAREAVRTSRERVESVLESGETVYGVTTGFGDLVDERIPPSDLEALQVNLLRSHAAGVGPELPREAVRAMLVARVNALVKGYSGVREAVVDALVDLLNAGVTPVVPAVGSLGASGDLAPLAHTSLVLVGEGEAVVDGEGLPGDEALATAGLDPLTLRAKEGLALINGTQLSVGVGALAVHDATRVVQSADVAGALTTEVTLGSTVPSHPAVSAVRPHPGQAASARNVRRCTAESGIVESHRNCDRVQDAYSLRCLPQVHGAVREAIDHLRGAVETELNSATDNPLLFAREDAPDRASGTGDAAVLSAGNFHGEPLALKLDYATAALTELAAISERRVDRLLNPSVQEPHLPPFLTEASGLRSGYMVAQYTAAAVLNECRATGRHATDSTPVSGNQEDHVSMSAGAALSLREVVEHVGTVVGIELLCGAQATEFLDGETAVAGDGESADDAASHGVGTAVAYETVREVVPRLDGDREVHVDIDRAATLVAAGLLVERVSEAVDLE